MHTSYVVPSNPASESAPEPRPHRTIDEEVDRRIDHEQEMVDGADCEQPGGVGIHGGAALEAVQGVPCNRDLLKKYAIVGNG